MRINSYATRDAFTPELRCEQPPIAFGARRESALRAPGAEVRPRTALIGTPQGTVRT